MWFRNIGISSRVNGQEILVDEDLLHDLFGLSKTGCVVRKEKRVSDYFDEEGKKVVADLAEIKRITLEQHGVVKVEEKHLDQNDLGVHWKMVHLSFTKIIQPKSHT